jgi:hypothetical protein
MTETDYEIWCCDEHVATVTTTRKLRVRKWNPIQPPSGETPHMSIATVPAGDGLETADLHSLTHMDAGERHVTELQWVDHRSWIIRCRACTQQFEITESRLPWLAHVLQAGDWSITGGTVPLAVLNRARQP